MQTKYKEAFRNLRDALGGNQALSSFPSVSSLQASDNSIAIKDANRKAHSTRKFNSEKGHGILMSDEDVIFNHMDMFCDRVKAILDEMQTLAQLQVLCKTTMGLSKPKKDDLGLDDDDDDDDDDFNENDDGIGHDVVSSEDENKIAERNFYIGDDEEHLSPTKNRNMDPLMEEDSELSLKSSGKKSAKNISKSKSSSKISDNYNIKSADLKNETSESKDNKIEEHVLETENSIEKLFRLEREVDEDSKKILQMAQTLSKEDLRIMSKLYPFSYLKS